MSQQQTWTEWFFGSSSTQSSNDPSSSPSVTTAVSQPSAPDTKASSHVSPYGPYIKTGRGGAGNYTWQSEIEAGTSQRNDDIEAHNHPSDLLEQADAAAQIEQHDTEVALRNQRDEQQRSDGAQYVRVGRAMVERKDLEAAAAAASSPSNNTKSAAPIITTRSDSNTVGSDPVRPVYRGRGGAGNYAAALEVTEKQKMQKDEQDRLAADQRREQVTQHVENTIPAPPGVWLGPQKKSRDGELS